MAKTFQHEGFISKITTLADGTLRVYIDLQEFDNVEDVGNLYNLHKIPALVTIDASQPFTEVEKILANENTRS